METPKSVTRRVFRNVLWTLGSDLVARGSSLWLSFYCARLLPIAGFGLFALGQAIAQYGWSFGDSVANSGYATREMARADRGSKAVWGEIYTMRLAAGLLLGLLGLIIGGAFRSSWDVGPVILATSIYFVAYPLFPDWVARGMQDFKALALANLAAAACLIVLALTWFRSLPSPAVACAVWAIPFVPGAIVLHILLRTGSETRFRFALSAARWKHHFSHSFLFSLGGVGVVGVTLLPTLLCGALSSAEQVGLFAAGFRIVGACVGLGAVFWLPVYPALASVNRESEAFRSLFDAFLAAMLSVALPASIGLCVFADEIVRYLFGPRYVDAARVLQVSAWAVPLNFLLTVFEITVLATGGELQRAKAYALAVAVLAVGSVALIPRWGAMGAAAAHLVAITVALGCFARVAGPLVRRTWLRTSGKKIVLGNAMLSVFWIGLRPSEGLGVWLVLGLGAALYAVYALIVGIFPREVFTFQTTWEGAKAT